MGGAVFVRSGSFTAIDTTFSGNSATRGNGSPNGKGLGGAIFAMKNVKTDPISGNPQGMPSVLPVITLSNIGLSGNTATDDGGSTAATTPFSSVPGVNFDNDDLFINFPAATIDFAAADYTIKENEGSAIVTLNRTNVLTGTSIVNVTVANGSATGGSDYTSSPPITVTFAPDETSKTISVSIIDDADIEDGADETIDLSVALDPSDLASVLGTQKTSTLSIADNDINFALSTDKISVLEDDSGATTVTYTIARTGSSSGSGSVNYTIAGTATNGTDYNNIGGTSGATGTSGTINFAVAEASKTITLDVLGDTTTPETNKAIEVSLSSAVAPSSGTATVNGSPVTTTIQEDDGANVLISSLTTTATEGGATGTYTIELAKAPTADVTVRANAYS